jgi:PAS domain-containing protein
MEITKLKPQLSIALKQATGHLQRARNALRGLGRSIVEKRRRLGEALRTRADELKLRLRSSRDAIAVTSDKIAKLGSRSSVALRQTTRLLEQARNTVTGMGRGVVEKARSLGEALRSRANELKSLPRSFRDAIAATSDKIASFGSRVTGRLKRARDTLTGFVKSVFGKRRKLREALRTREDELESVLASSLDAVVVTNGVHRFLATNPRALDLFGVSETNITQFTLDVFFSHGQIADFDRNGSSFIRRQESHGKCKIRRLDGSSRVAEYVFVANFAPLRHLIRFYDVTPRKKSGLIRYTTQSRPQESSNSGQLAEDFPKTANCLPRL